jgi:hypothetical protein
MPARHEPGDQFARASVELAHKRIGQVADSLEQRLQRISIELARRRMFQHRCHLCGDPVRKGCRYCHAHSWAEGA